MHHSQEELSILTTFRAHPLVHVSFLISAVPILAISSNAATPAVVLTIYACLGALPHANVRWTYGQVGRVLISPAYHRIHHAATGRLDINLGTVFTVWDALSRRAVFPAAGEAACATGPVRPAGAGRAGRRAAAFARTFLTQWAEPFTATREVREAMTVTREKQAAGHRPGPRVWAAVPGRRRAADRLGAIHLHLWDIAYRHVKTLGPLFLVQVSRPWSSRLALLVTRHILAVRGRPGAVAGTIVGFILARTVGIFGFKLPFSSGLANMVLIIEIVAIIALAITALLLRRADTRG